MKKLLISIMLIMFGWNVQGQNATSTQNFQQQQNPTTSLKRFSGYVEQLNIFNIGSIAGKVYSTGANLSFGTEFPNRLYVGGGLSMYYLNCRLLGLYYDENGIAHGVYLTPTFAMDFFADIKYKFLSSKITPIVGCKLGLGFTTPLQNMNIVTRPSFGCLFKLGGRHELMVNIEYIPAAYYLLHGISLNIGYKF